MAERIRKRRVIDDGTEQLRRDGHVSIIGGAVWFVINLPAGIQHDRPTRRVWIEQSDSRNGISRLTVGKSQTLQQSPAGATFSQPGLRKSVGPY